MSNKRHLWAWKYGLSTLLLACAANSAFYPTIPAPLAFKEIQGLEIGQIKVETLKTSEKIPSPRWLAIDSKDRLYVTVGNNHDSILYAVELQSGQVTKYKSGAYDRPEVKQAEVPGCVDPGFNPNQKCASLVSTEGKEVYQDSPTIAVDGADNIYLLLPYNKSLFFQTGALGQLHKIQFTPLWDLLNPGYQLIFTGDDAIFKEEEGPLYPKGVHGKAVFIRNNGDILISENKNIFCIKIENQNKTANILNIQPKSQFDMNQTENLGGVVSIAEDQKNNLFLAVSHESGIIYKSTPEGLTYALLGSAITSEDFERFDKNKMNLPVEERFKYPSGIVVDKAGLVYVADSENHRIRKIWPDENKIETLAGTREAGYADSDIGTEARFRRPIGMAWDSKGNLYIADSGNDAIRVIRPNTHNFSQGEL